MEIPVTVYTDNPKYIIEVSEDSIVSADQHWEWPLADGLRVRYGPDKIRLSLAPIQLILILSEKIFERISPDVVAALIAGWLLKKFDKDEAKVTKLEIDRTTVELDENEIRKIVREKITQTS